MKNILLILIVIAMIGFLVYYFWFRPVKLPETENLAIDLNSAILNGTDGAVSSIPQQSQGTDNEVNKSIKNNMHLIKITTNYGEIQFETHDADAPKTVENFVNLASKKFYDGLTFHRVIRGFMIQGGDPNGNGTGGPGYSFADELDPNTQSYREGYKKGVVAMANAGPNTNGSQFFIMLENYPLPNNYTIFGRVTKGQDIVDKIGSVKTRANDLPVEPVFMSSVTVLNLK